jgi:hypothetical protein
MAKISLGCRKFGLAEVVGERVAQPILPLSAERHCELGLLGCRFQRLRRSAIAAAGAFVADDPIQPGAS